MSITDVTSRIAGLPDKLLQQLASLGQSRSFPKNAVVVVEGDPGNSLYVILSGKVKVYLSGEDGREVILGHFGPGDYFGEMTLDGGPRTASVMCLEPSTFSVVTREPLLKAIAADPEFALKFISTVIARARFMTDMVKNLALLDVYGRVARLLLDLAVEQEDGTLRVTETLTQRNIADRVGASCDMVHRIMRELCSGGYISVDHRQITVLRPPPKRW
jgi:CRP/FNR family transcriptional regulator, cyclic AMP receptor protein